MYVSKLITGRFSEVIARRLSQFLEAANVFAYESVNAQVSAHKISNVHAYEQVEKGLNAAPAQPTQISLLATSLAAFKELIAILEFWYLGHFVTHNTIVGSRG